MKPSPRTILAAACLATASMAAAITFSDSTFNPGDWSLTTVVNTGGLQGLSQAFQDTFFGNPPPSRKIDLSAPGISGINTMMSFNEYLLGSYNPAVSGAIAAINYQEDGITKFGIQNFGAAIRQGSQRFVTVGAPNTHAWATYTLSGLTASSFGLVDPNIPSLIDFSINPDFSAAGAALHFGFYRLVSSNGSANDTIGDIDNWSVITKPVPEPASILALAVGAWFWRGRRQRR